MRLQLAYLLFFGSFVFASNPTIKVLEIYPNATMLSYKSFSNSGTLSFEVPSYINKENINIATTCEVQKSTLSDEKDIKDTFEQSLNNLMDKRELLERRLEATRAKSKLLQSYTLKDTSLKSLQENSTLFEDLLLKSLELENRLKKDVQKIEKEIKKVSSKRSFQAIRQLDIQLKCTQPSTIIVSFPLRDIFYSGISKISANTQKKSVKIAQEALITHSLGDMLQPVDIRLYSFAYSRSMYPIPFSSYFIDTSPKFQKAVKRMGNMPMAAEVAASGDMAYMQTVEEETRTKRVWEVKAQNLRPGEQNEIVFNVQTMPAKFENFIDGYGSVKAYLKSNFTPKQSISGQKSKLFIDGLLIGEKYIKPINKENNATLFFGENSFIKITKKFSKDFTDESIFGTSKTTKKLWKYEIENQGQNREKITLVERLPISKHEKIKVTLHDDSKPDKILKDGQVIWYFTLMPKSKKEIFFGFDVEQPIEE